MVIGIATENKPKVGACKSILKRLSKQLHLPPDIEIVTKKTNSSISEMPITVHEMMSGAYNRAKTLYAFLSDAKKDPKFCIGAEGGFFVQDLNRQIKKIVFLQSWVYVFDGNRGFWGSSGAIPVPSAISIPVLTERRELAEVIDEVSGQKDVRSQMGAAGIFTDGVVHRQHLFEEALIFALAPFYSPIYQE